MSASLKEQIARYAEQQNAMFGSFIVERRMDVPAAPADETATTAPTVEESSSPLAEALRFITEDWVHAASPETLDQMICSCQKCPLGSTRKNFVFGVGNPNADLVVIGEAPGADEDARGEPFVGAAGQLLNKILAAINFQREEVFICNILKCRPPGNRRPEPPEVEQCRPYLLKQLDLIQPKFILAVGLTAANTLLGRTARMGELRGTMHDFYGMNLFVTYHPAALLRKPQWKRATWEDVQFLRREYDAWKASSQ